MVPIPDGVKAGQDMIKATIKIDNHASPTLPITGSSLEKDNFASTLLEAISLLTVDNDHKPRRPGRHETSTHLLGSAAPPSFDRDREVDNGFDERSKISGGAALGRHSAGFVTPLEFLRALYSFQPPAVVAAANGSQALMAPIKAGEVISAHAIQSNGWVFGTVLDSGAKGWIPGNYCKAYQDGKIRALLEAVVGARQMIAGAAGAGPAAAPEAIGAEEARARVMEHTRRILRGVQRLLHKTNCLERQALSGSGSGSGPGSGSGSGPGSDQAGLDPVMRARQRLLGHVSTLVKASKRADHNVERKQQQQQQQGDQQEVEMLHAAVLHSATLVLRSAVLFLDAWTQRAEGGQAQAPLPPAPPVQRMPTLKATNQQQQRQPSKRQPKEPAWQHQHQHQHQQHATLVTEPGKKVESWRGKPGAVPCSTDVVAAAAGAAGVGRQPSLARTGNLALPFAQTRAHSAPNVGDVNAQPSTKPVAASSKASTAWTTTCPADEGGNKAVRRGAGSVRQRAMSIVATANTRQTQTKDQPRRVVTEQDEAESRKFGSTNNRSSDGNGHGNMTSTSVGSSGSNSSNSSSATVKASASVSVTAMATGAGQGGRGFVDHSPGDARDTLGQGPMHAKAANDGSNARLQASRPVPRSRAPLTNAVTGTGNIDHATRPSTSRAYPGAQSTLHNAVDASLPTIPTLPESQTIPREYYISSTASSAPSVVPSTSAAVAATAAATTVAPLTTSTTLVRQRNAHQLYASTLLQKAHDDFIGSLGALVGSRMHIRSSTDLSHTAAKSFNCCQDLLDVATKVWEQDSRRSHELARARIDMEAMLNELDRAARGLAASSPTLIHSSQRQPLGERNDLVNVATLCVRSANDCFAETISVIDKIGDFDFDLTPVLDLRLSGTFSRVLSDENSAIRTLPARDAPPRRESLLPFTSFAIDSLATPHNLAAAPPPPIPKARSSQPLRTCNSTIFPSPALSSTSDTFTFTSSITSPNLSLPTRSPVIDVEIPRTSTSDFWRTRRPLSPPPNKKMRSGSFGTSPTDGGRTRIGSMQQSDLSLDSDVSTLPTSPDVSPVKEYCDRPMHDSFGPFTDTKLTILGDEVLPDPLVLDHTYAHELILGTDGHVRGGSLRALVEKLTPYDATPDQMFLNTFYLTFRLFTTPVNFAQALIHRFDYVGQNPLVATPVRLRVYNVFKGWLETYWRMETDVLALEAIARFALSPLKAAIPSAGKRLMELVEQASDKRHRPALPRLVSTMGKTNTAVGAASVPSTNTPLPCITKHQLNMLKNTRTGGASCNILDFDPLELARQITLIKSRIYCRIEPEELLAQEWRKGLSSKSVNVKAMSVATTDLANLVTDTILAYDEPRKRATAIKHWVKVAKHARELCNYESLKAILLALDSSPIHRLRKTWELVSPRTMARLEELTPIIDASRNWFNLRTLMRNHPVPCVPSVSNYLTDLAFTDEGNTVERLWRTHQPHNGGINVNMTNPNRRSTVYFPTSRPFSMIAAPVAAPIPDNVINFEKHLLTARSIGEIQRFQSPYHLAPVMELQEWLESEFRRVRQLDAATGGQADGESGWYRRSLKLEPRESQCLAGAVVIPPVPTVPVSMEANGYGGASGVVTLTGSVKGRERFWSSLPRSLGHRDTRSLVYNKERDRGREI